MMFWSCCILNRSVMIWLVVWILTNASTTRAIRRIPSSLDSQRRRLQDEFLKSLQDLEDGPSWMDERENRRKMLVAEDHLVKSLPLLEKELSSPHYAGHIEASADDDKKLFYWLFTPEDQVGHKEEDIPLLIWLNGGPACSSMDGLFIETGPFQFHQENQNAEIKLIQNPHSWHKSPAYLLFIDQPVGTGLSFTKKKKYAKNDKEVNDDFYFFLQEFFQLHHELFLKPNGNNHKQQILKRPFFFSGESHAGHYIPSMISYIEAKNNAADAPSIIIPVAGAAIGNGWVDPYYQYAGAELAYGAGLIDLAQKAKLDKLEKECQEDMKVRKQLSSPTCHGLQTPILDDAFGSKSDVTVSSYDYTLFESKDVVRTYPPGHKTIESYLGGWTTKLHPKLTTKYKDVLKAIHATESISAKQRYLECTDPPYYALADQDGLGVADDVANLLQGGKVKFLFFNGMNDIICNHVGNERFLEHLKWDKVKDWILAKRYAWNHSKESKAPAGYVKVHENLIFLKVKDAGHMVPLDKPALSLEMIRSFLYGLEFTKQEAVQSGLISVDDTKDDDKCEKVSCPICETSSPTSSPTAPITDKQYEVDSKQIEKELSIDNNSTTTTTKSFENMKVHNESKSEINESSTSFDGWKGFSIGAVIVIVILMLRNRRKSESPFPTYDDESMGSDDMDIEVTQQKPYRDNVL